MLTFHLLGPLEVRNDGALIGIGPRKLRELLAILLLAGEGGASSDRIEESMWGDRAPKNARASIHVYVSQLRSALGDTTHEVIQTTDVGYRIPVEAHSVDLQEFDDLVANGLELLERGRSQEALAVLDESLAMLRGNPLSDFIASDFSHVHIHYVGRRRIAALEGRLQARLDLGANQQVATEARQLLNDDPYNEEVWAALMLALYRSLRRTEALRSYQIAVSELAEAGLEPSDRLTELEARIVAQDPSLSPDVADPPNNLVDDDRATAPAAEVARLQRDVAATELVVLTGPPTETRPIVVETARRRLKSFPDGTWVVDVTGGAADNLLVRAILDELTIVSGPDPAATLAEYLRGRVILLVLLGADHVGAEIAWLTEVLLDTAPGSRVIATASTPPTPTSGLTRRLRPASPVVQRPAANTDAELVLARMNAFGGPVSLDAIRHVVGHAPIEPGNVDYLLGQLLADGRVLADNSGPVSRFSPDTAEVAPRTPDRASRQRHADYCLDLAERLIVGLDGPGRRDLLGAARADHEELRLALANSWEEGDVSTALVLGRAAGRYWSYEGSYIGRTITVLEPLVRGVPVSSADAAGIRLSVGFAHFRSGSYKEAAGHYDDAITMALDVGEPATAGAAFAERAHLQMFLGLYDAATTDLDRAAARADQTNWAALEARCRMLRAQLSMRSGQSLMAPAVEAAQLDAAIRIYGRLGHQMSLANSLLVKASWYLDNGSVDDAVAATERALEITHLGNDRSMLGFALGRSAEALLERGEIGPATERATEAMSVSIETGNWLVAALGMLALGMTDRTTGSRDPDVCIGAFLALRHDLGVPLTSREQRWVADRQVGSLSADDARDLARSIADQR